MSAKQHFKTAQSALKRLLREEDGQVWGAWVIVAQLRTNLERSGKTLDDLAPPGVSAEKLDEALAAASRNDLTKLKALWRAETPEQIVAALAAAIPDEGKAYRKNASLKPSARVAALFDAASTSRPAAAPTPARPAAPEPRTLGEILAEAVKKRDQRQPDAAEEKDAARFARSVRDVFRGPAC